MRDPLNAHTLRGQQDSGHPPQRSELEPDELPARCRIRPARSGYNYTTQEPSLPRPRRAQLLRYDLRPTDKDTISIKYQNWFTKVVGWEVDGGSSRWGLVRQRYDFTADQGKVDWTHIITPHLVNEASIGIFYSTEGGPPEDDLALASIQRDKDRFAALGECFPGPFDTRSCPATGTIKTGGPLASLRQIAPGNNPLNLIPKAVFGTLQNNSQAAPDISLRQPMADRGGRQLLPHRRQHHVHARRPHLQGGRIARSRAIRAGTRQHLRRPVRFLERRQRPEQRAVRVCQRLPRPCHQLQEAMGRRPDNRRQFTWSWFVQDTWKVRRNLTLDIGVRMYKWAPSLNGGGEASVFSFERFDPTWGGKPPV